MRLLLQRVTGAQVREWLERSAGIFNQIKPGSKDADLIDLTFPSYNFDVIDGVTYKIDVSQPSRYDQKGVVQNADAHRIVESVRADIERAIPHASVTIHADPFPQLPGDGEPQA